MRPSISSLCAAALPTLLALSHASIVEAHHLDQVVEYPVKRVPRSTNDSHSVSINNEQWIYTVEIAIGNPPQKTLVQVDTGSSDLWVNANCSSAPTQFNQQEMCKQVPRYDPDSSRSGKGPLGSKLLGYGSSGEPNGAMVDIYEDTVTVGDIKVKNQKFGVASDSRGLPVGIMGLGPVFNASFAVNESYYLLLDSMAEQKAIASRAYSLGLGTADDEQGSLIFGGLDKGKFFGNLTKTPIVESRDGGARLTVNISSIGADAGNGTSKKYPLKDTNFHLDTGHTFSRLNKDLAEEIFRDTGAQLDKRLGFYLIDCKVRDHAGGITFGFGDDKVITVPFREFIYTAQGLCAVGVEPVEKGEQQILGDSFLRAAYVVFDLDNKNVHIAQAASCESEIVSIGAGNDAVPSVVGNCLINETSPSSGSDQRSYANAFQVPIKEVFALTSFVLLVGFMAL
ncbi:hypothetical protein FSARC_12701 [Fusarium sarcochroum]|uniref:Peptidase A1 domain-containing protein n=1 Tax=Fusarium sarcochroum TaxID=1208366 RepID=A0A8H4T6L1_9HYPO|nr:hypothetical protein FSARC_12701 [Fusarium sarcochroum]